MPSAHTNQVAIEIEKLSESMNVNDASTYGADNHAQAYFSKILMEITRPDYSVERAASYDFSLGDYAVIQSPADVTSLSVEIEYTILGYYQIDVYAIPVTGAGGNTYGLNDCFFRVADSKIYKVVAAGGVDITVDTTFTDTSKYSVITIKDVTSRYKATTTIFAFTEDIKSCFQTILTKGKCVIQSDVQCNDCSNADLISAYDVAMMMDLFEYVDETNTVLDIASTVDYARSICADDSCCETPLVSISMGDTECAACGDEDSDSGDEECCDSLQGLRYKTDAVAIQVSGAPKKRKFTELLNVAEDDIISVTVGDTEYSFEIEIIGWESSTGTMEFIGELPENVEGLPIWIRIQWMKRST